MSERSARSLAMPSKSRSRPPVSGARARAAARQPVHHRMRGEDVREPLVGREQTQDLGEREVRQTHVTEVHAVPGEHRHPGAAA